MNGHGRLIYANGDVYDGDFANGHANGKVYEGEFDRGMKQGKGKFI